MFSLTAFLVVLALLAAQSRHTLLVKPGNVVIGHYDAKTPPALRIRSGDLVEIHTLGVGRPEQLEAAGLPRSEMQRSLIEVVNAKPDERGHFLTGPVYIEGAQPGGVLEVQIRSIRLAVNYAYNSMGANGTLADEFPQGGRRIIPLYNLGNFARFAGTRIPLRPFFGSMGVAPPESAGRISSTPPGIHAGNLDNKELVAGTKLFIPIHVRGALFQVGDGHAAQGDGEVDQTALETSLIGEFRFLVHNDRTLKWPRAETPTHYIAMGIDEDLQQAVKIAVQETIAFLMVEKRLSKADAYMLCSMAVDLRITQLVDRKKGVHAMIPKAIFPP